MAEKVATTKDTKSWMGAFEAYSVALGRIRQNLQPYWAFAGIYLVVALISAAIQGGKTGEGYTSYETIVTILLLVSIPLYGLAVADKRSMSVNEFFKPRPKLFFILIAVVVLNALIAGISLLLLIFPIIWTLAWFYMTTFVAVDKGQGPIAALKQSKQLAQNHKAKVWGIVGVGILLNIGVSIFSGFLPGYAKVIFESFAVTFLLLWIDAASALLYRHLQSAETE